MGQGQAAPRSTGGRVAKLAARNLAPTAETEPIPPSIAGRSACRLRSTNRDFYYSDQWQMLADYNGSTPRYLYFWGLRYPDDLISRVSYNGGTYSPRYYALHDYLHVNGVLDASGNVNLRLGYDAYGTPRVMDANYTVITGTPTPSDWEFRFGAAYYDSESGIYQMCYRYLNPLLGNWMTRDPIGFRCGEVNLALFASANPASIVDALGLYPKADLETMERLGPGDPGFNPYVTVPVPCCSKLACRATVAFFAAAAARSCSALGHPILVAACFGTVAALTQIAFSLCNRRENA